MNDTAAASVSLEGRNIWIARSLPVEPWKILRAKLRVQMILTLPALLLASICAAIMLKAPAGETLALLVLPQLSALFFALLDLTLDLWHANLGWTNELAPIKQSMPVAVAVLGGFGYAVALAGVYLLLMPPFGAAVYLWSFAAVTGAASLLLYLRLRRKGGRVFMEL
jgi:ABC-2 type transport system permease protein